MAIWLENKCGLYWLTALAYTSDRTTAQLFLIYSRMVLSGTLRLLGRASFPAKLLKRLTYLGICALID